MADGKATRIALLEVRSLPMRTFHMTWFAFFLCFFGWFGIAPLMPVVRESLELSKAELANTMIASVAITVLVRLIVGPLCDRYGPRRVYSLLLVLGSLPVMLIGLAQSYESFLLFRLAIGAIGASFVITQYHTSVMFAPNVVGAANATTAGWGNLGGGVTQMVMPLALSAILMLGVEAAIGWRLAMVVPGLLLLAAGVAYFVLTRDCPRGDYRELRARGVAIPAEGELGAWQGFCLAARDHRVWALFVAYSACFGVELTVNNIAAIYFFDTFDLGLAAAGLVASLFGLMNLFARSLGGIGSDRAAARFGLGGRVRFLFAMLLLEGLALLVFAGMQGLAAAIALMVLFSLFVQMSEGATFALVPFVQRRALGAVAGIVGAGGNVGAVAAGFLFKSEVLSYQAAFFCLGAAVIACSACTLLVRFSPETQSFENRRFAEALALRRTAAAAA